MVIRYRDRRIAQQERQLRTGPESSSEYAAESPASMIFSDDIEMLERCQLGLAEQATPWVNFSRGQGHDRNEENDRLSGAASEMPMRVQFAAWKDYMSRARG